ncbi:hypothetical protein CPB83DRAFT_759641 [Crepidotus variabilis]|uniref:Uncharacterized protein n=1 Tax=Crepidotus variabilis TaxID=179855 RepID=A0A9P6EP33_9AGAR|nr:hypothetical protein CPB83DRAFT_759641 [Crepidotus variabilis]
MPRRSPPSSLLLFQGPTPPRNAPRHHLPSMPVPAVFRRALEDASVGRKISHDEIVIPKMNSPTIRGPWDHSRSIKVAVNVDQILAPMARAMVVSRG